MLSETPTIAAKVSIAARRCERRRLETIRVLRDLLTATERFASGSIPGPPSWEEKCVFYSLVNLADLSIYQFSTASKLFASLRSAVSKPSLNQL